MFRFVIIAALLAASPAAAGVTIVSFNTGASADPFLSLGNGSGSTTVVGQSFVAAGDGVLHSFSFKLGDGTPGNIAFELATWNGVTATGSELYRTPRQAYDGAATFNFGPLGVALVTGNTYIAYLTTSGVSDPAQAVPVLQRTDNSYTYGSAFVLDTAGRSPLSGPRAGQAWTATGSDLAFAAVFGNGGGGQYGGITGSVPEPADWLLLIAGFGLTGAALRRRRAAASFSIAHS